ncbi:MAG: hypothetical protein H5U07_11120 [Candidatus Aminicenantes bacterium]|nr:hypothetical protein [Candidatus Aminicenantes bacterium]
MKTAAVRKPSFRIREKSFGFCFIFFIIFSLFSQGLPAQQKSPVKLKVDPFYLQLLEEGKSSFNNGDHENAFQSLKLAAFGFLDEPDLLGEALVYLTVTAYTLKRDDQVTHYLKEIMRFKLTSRISASSLPPDLKKKFEKIQSDYKMASNG